MHQRCYNPRSHNFKYYGGRGIKVCERWHGRRGFDNFVDDMGFLASGLTLGRKKNDGPYNPENCRWETWKEQAANRRNGHVVDPGSIRQRCLAAGLDYHRVMNRVHGGWTLEEAMKLPVGSRCPRFKQIMQG